MPKLSFRQGMGIRSLLISPVKTPSGLRKYEARSSLSYQ